MNRDQWQQKRNQYFQGDENWGMHSSEDEPDAKFKPSDSYPAMYPGGNHSPEAAHVLGE